MASTGLQEVWGRFKSRGDDLAREALIENYSYLVKITVGRIAGGMPPNLDREDLVSAGIIGLIRAVDQFDPGRDVKFETYAIALIRGAILELMRGEDWAPRSVRDKIRQLERAYAAVETEMGRPGTEPEIAAHMGLTLDEFYRLLGDVGQANLLSLDDLLFGDGEGTMRVGDTLRDSTADTASHVEMRHRKAALAKAIDRLPERERLVLSLYYYEGFTFKEIGRVLGVSESRVFQLHQQAIIRLRGYLSHDRELFSTAARVK
jgi:RNA polymerase sigma factor FliA